LSTREWFLSEVGRACLFFFVSKIYIFLQEGTLAAIMRFVATKFVRYTGCEKKKMRHMPKPQTLSAKKRRTLFKRKARTSFGLQEASN
jgi:hypothetical protein